jgi:hypothetical protein
MWATAKKLSSLGSDGSDPIRQHGVQGQVLAITNESCEVSVACSRQNLDSTPPTWWVLRTSAVIN